MAQWMKRCEGRLRNDSKVSDAKVGDQCARWAVNGSKFCRSHKANANRKANERRWADFVAEERLQKAARRMGVPRDVDPATALLEEVSRTAGYVDWLAEKVAGLGGPVAEGEAQEGAGAWRAPGAVGTAPVAVSGDDALVWGVTEVSESTGQQGNTTRAQAGVNVWVDLLQRERAHLLKACTAALSAGLAERQVRVAEAQGALVAATIRAVLGDLGLNEGQWELVQEVVPRHLRALVQAGNPEPRSLPGGGRRVVVQ